MHYLQNRRLWSHNKDHNSYGFAATECTNF